MRDRRPGGQIGAGRQDADPRRLPAEALLVLGDRALRLPELQAGGKRQFRHPVDRPDLQQELIDVGRGGLLAQAQHLLRQEDIALRELLVELVVLVLEVQAGNVPEEVGVVLEVPGDLLLEDPGRPLQQQPRLLLQARHLACRLGPALALQFRPLHLQQGGQAVGVERPPRLFQVAADAGDAVPVVPDIVGLGPDDHQVGHGQDGQPAAGQRKQDQMLARPLPHGFGFSSGGAFTLGSAKGSRRTNG